MDMKNKYCYLIIILAIVLIVAILACAHWRNSQSLTFSENTFIALPNIPTPAGWYSWGTNHNPDYETSTIPNSVTFGNQPINANGNNTTTLIVVNAQNSSGQTDEQWIDTVLYPDYVQPLEAPTSSLLWSVVNEKLVLEAIIQTPAGGYNLYDYVFNNGAVYSFDLNPWRSDKNIASSPDAKIMRTMVQNFTENLSSATAP